MKKSEILEIIKEEVEVVLTNAEMIEMFDLDPAALLDEIMKEEEKGEKGYERPLEAALEEEKLDIEKMDLKKGRCTPMGTAECPEGSHAGFRSSGPSTCERVRTFSGPHAPCSDGCRVHGRAQIPGPSGRGPFPCRSGEASHP